MSARVAFATYARQPSIAEDDALLHDALVSRSVAVEGISWDDPSADWSTIDLCLLRSTWDYHQRRDEFVSWVRYVSTVTALWNPLSVVEWNTHKHYLRDLALGGVATVPTRWLGAGSRVQLDALLDESGCTEVIIKPAVGASSEGVVLASAVRLIEGQAHLETLLGRGDVMVQPFLPSVGYLGERSLILIDGVVAHAWRRQSSLVSDDEQVHLVEPEAEEIALAHAALSAAPGPAIYARVDLIHDEHGRPLLSELELIEPFLALQLAPDSAARLADAIMRLLQAGRSTA